MSKSLFFFCSKSHDPYDNLATEQHLLSILPDNSFLLYLWQNGPTVVIGKNQNPWAECNLPQLKQDGIMLARRLSGGGAVYHDLGNLNYTFYSSEKDYNVKDVLQIILSACSKAGIHAEFSGRNDLLVNNRKFSGCAFYHSKGFVYQHGTLLIDTSLENMTKYLTPPQAKLQAKGVSSVRSRVTNLKEQAPELTIADMETYLINSFQNFYKTTASRFALSEQDLKEINNIANKLRSDEWLYGSTLPFSLTFENQFVWGNVQFLFQVEHGIITHMRTYSDSLDTAFSSTIELALTGHTFSKPTILQALSDSNLETQIKTDLLQFFMKQQL